MNASIRPASVAAVVLFAACIAGPAVTFARAAPDRVPSLDAPARRVPVTSAADADRPAADLPPARRPARPAVSTTLLVNEVDYDQPGTDTAEFVEVLNVGSTSIQLSEYELRFVSETITGTYRTIVFESRLLLPGERYVVCGNKALVPRCDDDRGPDTNLIQNGPRDAVAIVVTASGTIVDTVSYEGNVPGYTETDGTGLVDGDTAPEVGISRSPDGTDTDRNNIDFQPRCITPGEPNSTLSVCSPVTTATAVTTVTATLAVTATASVTATATATIGATPTITSPTATATWSTAVPPPDTAVPPTGTPETATPIPSTPTVWPPTHTPAPPTATATAPPPTPTSTDVPATATPSGVPATATVDPTMAAATLGPTTPPPPSATPAPRLAVKLVDLGAVRMGPTTVLLHWRTLQEIDHAGFVVLRLGPFGAATPIDGRLLRARGDGLRGASYVMLDLRAPSGRALYALEDVDVRGRATRHGPVEVAPYTPGPTPVVVPAPERPGLPISVPVCVAGPGGLQIEGGRP